MEREEKEKTKASREKAKKDSIARTAEFEHSDKLDEEAGQATPRPAFTLKPRPLPRKQKKADPVSITEPSDAEKGDNSDSEVTTLPDMESDSADPPPKKQKTKATEKPNVKIGRPAAKKGRPVAVKKGGPIAAKKGIPVAGKMAGKRKKVETDVEDTMSSDKEETPKPKKVKVKMRDEINLATQEIVETKAKGKLYSDMVKSKFATQAGGQPARQPAPKVPSAADGGRKLKREGAMLNIYGNIDSEKVTSAKSIPQFGDGIKDNNDRYV
jgi:hypothetical protein